MMDITAPIDWLLPGVLPKKKTLAAPGTFAVALFVERIDDVRRTSEIETRVGPVRPYHIDQWIVAAHFDFTFECRCIRSEITRDGVLFVTGVFPLPRPHVYDGDSMQLKLKLPYALW